METEPKAGEPMKSTPEIPPAFPALPRIPFDPDSRPLPSRQRRENNSNNAQESTFTQKNPAKTHFPPVKL
jgi:hypothetical protein